MLEKLLSGEAGPAAEFSTVAIRMPKKIHNDLREFVTKHGLTIQSVGEAALTHALEELRRATPRPGVTPTKPRGAGRKS